MGDRRIPRPRVQPQLSCPDAHPVTPLHSAGSYPTELQPNLRSGDFLEAEYGSCKSHPDYDFVESSQLCLLGAAALGLHDTGPGGIITMFGASNPNASHWPHGCYWMPQENRLFFNSGGRSHSEDVTRRSVCSKSLGKVLEV